MAGPRVLSTGSVRQRWGMGERVQTRLSSKCSELGDLLLRLKTEGRRGTLSSLVTKARLANWLRTDKLDVDGPGNDL